MASTPFGFEEGRHQCRYSSEISSREETAQQPAQSTRSYAMAAQTKEASTRGEGAEFTQYLSKSQRKKLKRKQRQQGRKEHGETSGEHEEVQEVHQVHDSKRNNEQQETTPEHDDDSTEHFEDAHPEPQHQSDGEASEDLDHQESRVNEELVTAIVPFVSEVPLRCEVNISNNFSTLDTDDNVPKMQDELVKEAGLVSGRWSDQVETDPVQLPVKRGRGRPKKGEELIQKAGLSINDMKRAEEDTLIWLPELKGDFSTASAFEAIRNKGVRVHWHGAVWNCFTHPKLAANAWKLYSGRATTDLAAKKKGIQLASNSGKFKFRAGFRNSRDAMSRSRQIEMATTNKIVWTPWSTTCIMVRERYSFSEDGLMQNYWDICRHALDLSRRRVVFGAPGPLKAWSSGIELDAKLQGRLLSPTYHWRICHVYRASNLDLVTPEALRHDLQFPGPSQATYAPSAYDAHVLLGVDPTDGVWTEHMDTLRSMYALSLRLTHGMRRVLLDTSRQSFEDLQAERTRAAIAEHELEGIRLRFSRR
ncbi:hypothetical protein IFM89_007368 [Coptis chinensis]|uniref:Uncharacterized protein n=1 Tax=Coptis chinensis TaxID=261450 RepID=A0A835MDA0_9MAGN|nr:hypothetical protein IFM89_007368 [Coptis chinensis]